MFYRVYLSRIIMSTEMVSFIVYIVHNNEQIEYNIIKII